MCYAQEVLDWLKTKPEVVKKYSKPGIYCIKLNNEIVYVGQTKRKMIERIAEHIDCINRNNKKTMYQFLHLAQTKFTYLKIGFDVLEYCQQDQLLEREAYYINKFMPALNTQIPTTGRHYKVKKVDLQDLINRFVF